MLGAHNIDRGVAPITLGSSKALNSPQSYEKVLPVCILLSPLHSLPFAFENALGCSNKE